MNMLNMPPSINKKARWQVVCVPAIDSVEVGLAHQQTLADEHTSQHGTPILSIWRCRPALLITRSETRLPRFEAAAAAMQAAGWPVLLRKSGGGACPVGPGTVQISMIEAASSDTTMNAKYAALTKVIQSTLGFFQIVCRTGSVADAYCPGRFDLAVQDKKIAGMSQHWFRNRCGVRCIITAASINIEEPPNMLADVTNRFYGSAGSPLRCQASALTNLRLCAGTALLADSNLASAVMNQLGSAADMLSKLDREDFLR
jgi:lipoate-protein ligase A